MNNSNKIYFAIYVGIFFNILLAAGKWITGFFGNSYALIADAIESTSDIFTSLLLLLGLRYAQRPADSNHPYGHGRAEPLITFIVVGFLVISAIYIAYHSIENILIPHELPRPYTLVVLAIIVIIKELLFRFNRRRSLEFHSGSLHADAWHHRSDAITSLAAFIGISVALILGKGYESADDWAALLASAFILYNSYLIFRPALGEIMDEDMHSDLAKRIRDISILVPGIEDTEKLRIRKSGLQYFIDLHALVDGNTSVKSGHDLAHQLKNKLMESMPQLADVLIHIEPHEDENEVV